MNNNIEFEDKKIWVKGLMIHCPMGESVKDCPGNKIRLLPIPERLRKVDKMSEIEIDRIVNHHLKCLAERERLHFN